MAPAMSAREKKIFILWRLIEKDDRIVRQRPSDCGVLPDSAWFLLPPQMGGGSILGAVKWLERHGMIIQSIAPTTSTQPRASGDNDGMRRYYQGELQHRVYAASPTGRQWFKREFGR